MRVTRVLILIAVLALTASGIWFYLFKSTEVYGLTMAHGRLEAEQITLASKHAGRVADVLVKEGDTVNQNQLLLTLDSQQLLAKKREIEAVIEQTRLASDEASAAVSQRKSLLILANTDLQRAQTLYRQHVAPQEKLDQAQTQHDSAVAALRLAEATLKRSIASTAAAQANLEELQTLLTDNEIRAPRAGRIQYQLVHPGEVIAAGGRVLTLMDPLDVYMEVFVPASVAALLALQDDARLIFDAVPQYVIPGKIAFVAPEAQFTPKEVETRDARSDLMFRVKISIDPLLLQQYQSRVKSGVRGNVWLRTAPDAAWPAELAVTLPEA
ncbi:HlyD family secretion protein [Thalassolituus sp. LLYu03]|uniref:HlyD family secretion protein n=1 Tax=Thalassolituus sp. LLYu03 TaxID=3421656 RepID=UPI003D2B587E